MFWLEHRLDPKVGVRKITRVLKPKATSIRKLQTLDLYYESQRTFLSDLQVFAGLVLLILGKSHRADRDFPIPTR
jgi:hypothetical protein